MHGARHAAVCRVPRWPRSAAARLPAGCRYTGVKAKKYADKIVKKELTQGKDEHALPSIAAAMVLKLRTAKKAIAAAATGPTTPSASQPRKAKGRATALRLGFLTRCI
jgi:hypothetical protein